MAVLMITMMITEPVIQSFMENREVAAVIWDAKIETDKEIDHCRPDMVFRCNKSRIF